MLRSSLTNDDVSCDTTLAAKDFDAQPFGLGFPSILGATYTFFMCHYFSVLSFFLAAGFLAAGFLAAGFLA
ncbi:MAG: hypothetical protein ACO2XQ_09010, partial [Flavobacteriales bacterium]